MGNRINLDHSFAKLQAQRVSLHMRNCSFIVFKMKTHECERYSLPTGQWLWRSRQSKELHGQRLDYW